VSKQRLKEKDIEDMTLEDVHSLGVWLPFGTSIARTVDHGKIQIRVCCGSFWTCTRTGGTVMLSELVEEEKLNVLSQFAGWTRWSIMEIPADKGWCNRLRITLDDIRCDLLDSRIVTLEDAHNDADTELTPRLLVKALIAKHTALMMRLKA